MRFCLIVAALVAVLLPASAQAAAPAQIRVAVLLVNFQNDQRQPWTTSYISHEYNCCDTVNGQGVADFINKASFGQTTLTADVFGWYVTAVPSTNCALNSLAADANAQATAQGVNLGSYTNIAYVFPYTDACPVAGTSDGIGGHQSWINLDPQFCPDYRGACQEWHLFAHELGHNLGLWHASRLVCTDPAGQPVSLSNTCKLQEYQDGWDVMGCCGSAMPSNYERAALGWLPTSQQQTIIQTGLYRIPPANQAASPLYRIADGTGDYLYLENRAFQYLNYEYDGTTPNPITGGNLLIRRAVPFPCPTPCIPAPPGGNTELLQGQPATGGDAFPVGSTLTLPNAPVTITNQAWDGTNNTVCVSFNGQSCSPPPPPPPPPCHGHGHHCSRRR